MPTPFTHLLVAQRLLVDSAVPDSHRGLIQSHRGAFLLGSVAVDAQAICGMKREETHFFYFDRPQEDDAWRVMLAQVPALHDARRDPDWRAFLAGYVTHLSMDEIWSQDMTAPHFVARPWAAQMQRFLMLHVLLIVLDERDRSLLDESLMASLRDAQPRRWLPFLGDRVLRDWRDIITRQVTSGGVSETLDVYGSRLDKSPAELRAILDSPARMQADLWDHVAPPLVAEVEAHMLDHARAQLLAYLAASAP